MVAKKQHSIVVILIGFLIASCQTTETPQQVAQHFWQAVIEDRPEKVVEFSTLKDVEDYDRFSMDWQGYQPSFGKITIENNNANVESEFTPPSGTNLKQRKLTTFLLMQNEVWTVDYLKTRDAMKPDRAGGLFGKLNQLGKEISEQLGNSTDELNIELEQLGEKLEQLTDQLESEAAEGVEKFTEELEKSLEKLEESIDRALKEDRRQRPEQDDGKLQEI